MDGTKEEFWDYVGAVSFFNVSTFDAVFVDGRARVACAEAALLYMSQKSVLFIHDWERDYYRPILQWYTEIKSAGRMGVLQKK